MCFSFIQVSIHSLDDELMYAENHRLSKYVKGVLLSSEKFLHIFLHISDIDLIT